MKKLKEGLRKKLDLGEQEDIVLKKLNMNTKNTNYIAETNSEKYFVKFSSEENYKERKFYEFLERNPLLPTPLPVYKDRGMIVLPFVEGLKDTHPQESLEFISSYHNRFLNISPKEYKDFSNKEKFVNKNTQNFIEKVEKNKDLIHNFWKNVDEIKDFYHLNSEKNFENVPKILLHGDIHRKNLQKDEKTTFIFLILKKVTIQISRGI